MTVWATRAERGAADHAAVRAINLAAFPTPQEADLVDALRAAGDLLASWLAVSSGGEPVGSAVLSRCQVGEAPALALAPCAVLPAFQRRGAGSAAIVAALGAARAAGEKVVVVLGHAAYYPRFGFTPAVGHGIRVSFEVPDENLMVLALDPARPLPAGTIRYAPARADLT